MLCVLTSQVPAKLLEKNFSVTSCIIGIWATYGILSAGAGSSFLHALCGISADDAMLVIVHHRTTGFRCLQRVLPCWEKSRKAGCELKMCLRWNVSVKRWNRQIDPQDCEGMFWIPTKSSDIIGGVQLNKEGKRTHEATRRSVDNMWQAVPQSASLARTNHLFLKQRQAQVTVGTPYFAQGPKENSSSSHGSTCFKKKCLVLEQWRLPRKHLFHRSSRFAVFLPHLHVSLLATCKVEVVKPIHDMLWKCFTLYSELRR